MAVALFVRRQDADVSGIATGDIFCMWASTMVSVY